MRFLQTVVHSPTRPLHLLTVLLASLLWTSQSQAQVNFNSPRRDYVEWQDGKILLERELLNNAPAIAEKAAQRLQENIALAISILPGHAKPTLERIPFYLMYGPSAQGGGKSGSLEYFQKNAPLYRDYLDPRWQNCVVVFSAENYTQLSDFWALKAIVHELAHAWHLEQWPEDQPDILSAFRNSVQTGLHRNVKADLGHVLDASYASTNQLEYFAELSCMYFVGCDYQPFRREELESYDPVGYAMIERMWAGPVSETSRSPLLSEVTSETSERSSSNGRSTSHTDLRNWLDPEGNPVITARFKSYRKGIVTVVATDNSESAMAFNILSPVDQSFVLESIGAL